MSCVVGWTGRCPDPGVRARLVAHLHRLAELSAGYSAAMPVRKTMPGPQVRRPIIEQINEDIRGRVLVGSGVANGGRRVKDGPIPTIMRSSVTALEDVRLRGIDFKLFVPHPSDTRAHRMSFVFLETASAPFLNGRLVQVDRGEDESQVEVYLGAPEIELHDYLTDWIDLLLSWVKYFFIGDLSWRHVEEMQGYEDYRKVFSDVHRRLGAERAESATFDAILATFAQHADHWRGRSAISVGQR